jgi:hypothetical protein
LSNRDRKIVAGRLFMRLFWLLLLIPFAGPLRRWFGFHSITGCDTQEILEPAAAALDDVAVFISLLVVADVLFVVGVAWDDGLDASLLEVSPDRIGIIAFIGEELFDAGALLPWFAANA